MQLRHVGSTDTHHLYEGRGVRRPHLVEVRLDRAWEESPPPVLYVTLYFAPRYQGEGNGVTSHTIKDDASRVRGDALRQDDSVPGRRGSRQGPRLGRLAAPTAARAGANGTGKAPPREP